MQRIKNSAVLSVQWTFLPCFLSQGSETIMPAKADWIQQPEAVSNYCKTAFSRQWRAAHMRTQRLYCMWKTCTRPSRAKPSVEGEGYDVPTLPEDLLVTGGCRERQNQFWSGNQLWSAARGLTPMHRGSLLSGLCGTKRKSTRSWEGKVEGKVWEIEEEGVRVDLFKAYYACV